MPHAAFRAIGARSPRDPSSLPPDFWSQPPRPAAAYLFGSAVTGRRGPEPDLDVAILAGGLELTGEDRRELARVWRARLVDALGSERIDVVVLDGAPLELRHQVLRNRRLLYQGDERARVAFETAVSRQYCDLAWLRELFADRLKRELQVRGGG